MTFSNFFLINLPLSSSATFLLSSTFLRCTKCLLNRSHFELIRLSFCKELSKFGFMDAPSTPLDEFRFATSLTECLPIRIDAKTSQSSENLRNNKNKLVMFEGARTNNKVAFAPNTGVLARVFRAAVVEKRDIQIIKINHSNKSFANACQRSWFHFLKSLFVGSNTITLTTERISYSSLQIMDSLIVPFKILYARDPVLKLMNKDHSFYESFLEYYGK